MQDGEFRTLILAELDAVYRLACHLTRSTAEAEDVVQETYLRALRSASTFTLAPYGVRPWLFKILHNAIVTRGSKRQREADAIDGLRHASAGPAAAPPAAPVPTPGTIDWDGIDERLKLAIGELALPYRVAFLLSAAEGLKYREIAEVTDVPIGTVMSRLSRARAILAERLAGLAQERRLGPPAAASGDAPADDQDHEETRNG